MDVVERLELVFKFPEKKPPFMGVVYENEFTGKRLNQSWVNTYGSFSFQIRIEPDLDFLKLTLSQKELGEKYDYLISRFDEPKLKDFLSRTKDLKQINFGHVLKEFDDLKIIKTSVGFRPWVVKVDTVEFFNEH
jgi:hypothetical protein